MLDQQTLEERLNHFNELENYLEDLLMEDQTFFEDLHFLSVELNNNNQYFDEKLFYSCNSFSILTRLFNFYTDIIHRIANKDSSEENDDDTDIHTDQMRDFFELIFKLVQRSMNISERFLDHGMFASILKLFNNQKAVSLLFEVGFKHLLYKIVRIFYNLSKQLFYSETSYINDIDDVQILKQTSALFKKLTNNEESSDDNALFRLYLISLSYLQVKFLPKIILFDEDYFVSAKSGVIQTFFVEVSNEYLKSSEMIRWEFRNECKQLEKCRVTKLKFSGMNRHNVLQPYIIVDILNNLLFICHNDRTKELGFDRYKYFFYSIIRFGLDIEKTVALFVLKKFFSVEKILADILSNKELVDYLKSLQMNLEQEADNTIKVRLSKAVNEFLSEMSS